MIIPIKCFTCGNVLADKYRYYLEQVNKRKSEENISEDKVIYLTKVYSEKTIEGQEMDNLGITNIDYTDDLNAIRDSIINFVGDICSFNSSFQKNLNLISISFRN